VFFKRKAVVQWLRFVVADNVATANRSTVYVDIQNGTIGAVVNSGTATGGSATITALPNGWYRVSLTTAVNNSSTSVDAFWCSATGDGNGARVSGSNYYAWGAQLEAGSFPTSYIPTIASTVTRAADNISLGTGAFPYSATASTLYTQQQLGDDASGIVFASISDGGGGNFLSLLDSGGAYSWHIDSAFSGTGRCFNGTIAANAAVKLAGAAEANNFNVSFNGGIGTNDNSGAMPGAVANLFIGCNRSGSGQINGIVKTVAYFPTRKTNAELQALTA
jgi:hypothetical protein